MGYSPGQKAAVLKRMLPADNMAIRQLSKEEGISEGTLSDLIYDGTPRRMNRSVRASMTSVELSFHFTLIARHSRLCSSKMLSVLNALPSSVR